MSAGFFQRSREAILSLFRLSGKKVIICPETGHGEEVRVDASYAAWSALADEQHLRLASCTRWPERQDCAQACLTQLEDSPEGCEARKMLNAWYADKSCVYCHKPLGPLQWTDHHPALMSPGKITHEWNEIAPRDLPDVLKTHLPVCWDCHIAETFRRQHPDLVTDRDFHHQGSHHE